MNDDYRDRMYKTPPSVLVSSPHRGLLVVQCKRYVLTSNEDKHSKVPVGVKPDATLTGFRTSHPLIVTHKCTLYFNIKSTER